MAAVMHLRDHAYSVEIASEIERRSGRAVSVGALHATLSRLEGKRLLQSRFGDPTPERGGRPKKFVRQTDAGFAAFRDSVAALKAMLKDLPGPDDVVLA